VAAIVKGAEDRGLKLVGASGFRAETARGWSERLTADASRSATKPCLPRSGSTRTAYRKSRCTPQDGQGVMLVAVDGRAAGLVAVADPIKESAIGALRALREEGIHVVMLTGDSRATADAVAAKLGIDDVVAEVLPEQKAAAVKKFQAEAGSSAWRATASTTPGPGPGADRHRDGDRGRRCDGKRRRHAGEGRSARHRARPPSQPSDHAQTSGQNLSSPSSSTPWRCRSPAGVFYPFFGLLLNPMIASAAMSVSSVTVVGNALRLRRVPL